MAHQSEPTLDEARSLPLLPVTEGVVFPDMVVTIHAESDDAKHAFEAARHSGDDLLIVPRRDGGYSQVGTVVHIEQTGALPDGQFGAVVRGRHRARVGEAVVGDGPGLWVTTVAIGEPETTDRVRELGEQYRAVVRELLESVGGRRLTGLLDEARSPGALADTFGWWPALDHERRIELLETVDVEARLVKVLAWARDALAEVSVTSGINAQVGDDLNKAQREVILRRQLDAIRAELGEGTDDALADYRARLAALTSGDDVAIGEQVAKAINKEIDRLERLGDQSAEAGWIRSWLDTVFEIPWSDRTTDNLDLGHARAVLDADHTGLDDVKDRIIEFLAVRKLRHDRGIDASHHRRAGTMVVLVGPPGVGKTSLGESVARALGRKFVRTALGGIHDEAEIRGHRRTYVGARPGRIARALIDARSMNPVVLLDEIDKVGSDWRGDPTAALLEVLDPEQNHTFRDHYLEVDLDLSAVVFIATANTLDRVPAPLLDRMEIVAIAGYSEDEKLMIARDHLLPRVLERNGVASNEVILDDVVLRAVIADYTREAGVRKLEQRLDHLVRKAATKLASGVSDEVVTVDAEAVRAALGPARRDDLPAARVSQPGIATGLAVTGAGGDVLFVEAVGVAGDPGLQLTGQLGEVMRESGEIALSYLRAHAGELDIEPARLAQQFHVHFPSGAVPKDGPSAGITMTTALVSVATERQVRSDLAMTGEITLQGRVLPIGGVKEKLLAARRAGIREVILPAANEPDAAELDADLRESMSLRFVEQMSEVLTIAFAPTNLR